MEPPSKRVYAFIDGTNLHQSITELGWRLDYAALRVYLRDKFGVEKAFYFIGYVPTATDLYIMGVNKLRGKLEVKKREA